MSNSSITEALESVSKGKPFPYRIWPWLPDVFLIEQYLAWHNRAYSLHLLTFRSWQRHSCRFTLQDQSWSLRSMVPRWLLPILLQYFVIGCLAANPVTFCKCFCGSNSTIFELPTNESKPCSLCTKQFCLDNVENGICDGIADETCPSNDFRTACFGESFTLLISFCLTMLLIICSLARDSFKDEFIVCLFLALTVGLVLSAAAKPYIEKWHAVSGYGCSLCTA